MAAPKSLLRSPTKLSVDRAEKAHNCQRSSAHRVNRGDKRLKVFTDPRSPEHFCVLCALKIIEDDIGRLQALAEELRSSADGVLEQVKAKL